MAGAWLSAAVVITVTTVAKYWFKPNSLDLYEVVTLEYNLVVLAGWTWWRKHRIKTGDRT